jgi:hypothetical protein
VNNNIKKDQKIYIRKDKFDFELPAKDIFEQREFKKQQIEDQEEKTRAIDYLHGLKMKPF